MIQELLQKKDVDDEEEGLISNPLRLFSAQLLDTDLQERKLQEFYVNAIAIVEPAAHRLLRLPIGHSGQNSYRS